MGKIIIDEHTMKDPVSCMGSFAGYCYGTDTTNQERNAKRGMQCVDNGHGRVLEFPDIYVKIEGYSTRVVREFMRHVGDGLTVMQESTRYVDYSHGFDYVRPRTIDNNEEAASLYDTCMSGIWRTYIDLIELGIPKEDAANVLPLGGHTKLVRKINSRCLMDMSKVRTCSRAYWEYRELMRDFRKALEDYSDEWKQLCPYLFKTKCDTTGYCEEHVSCGRYPKKQE